MNKYESIFEKYFSSGLFDKSVLKEGCSFADEKNSKICFLRNYFNILNGKEIHKRLRLHRVPPNSRLKGIISSMNDLFIFKDILKN